MVSPRLLWVIAGMVLAIALSPFALLFHEAGKREGITR